MKKFLETIARVQHGTRDGQGFPFPIDLLVQTLAIIGIRGSGKTVTAHVLAEAFYNAGLPWVALDPVGVWWGLRAGKDGSSNGGLKNVVVIGGKHGDIPIDKTAGQKIAEAVVEMNVCVVIDLSQESKTTWRRFLTDFCRRLMNLTPKDPRHFFIEEAAEFAPQRTKVAITAECKEAVERLVRLGRNNGYGCTLINQRTATIDKDVLSQCENLFMMRVNSSHDRKACGEWLEPKFAEQGLDEAQIKSAVKKLTMSLAALKGGECYFWSPSWLEMFERLKIRDKTTFHPGATRSVGSVMKHVELADAGEFVEKVRSRLVKKDVVIQNQPPPATPMRDRKLGEFPTQEETITKYRIEQQADRGNFQNQIDHLKSELAKKDAAIANERRGRQDAERRLAAVRAKLKPEYDALRILFEELGQTSNVGAVDHAVFEPWLAKAGRAGCRRILEILIEQKELTRNQLGTLSGTPAGKSTFRKYMSWLKSNGLAEVDRDMVKLRAV